MTRAALSNEPGIVCRPESQITMWKPHACQIDITMRANSAVLGSLSQSGPRMPNLASSALIRPFGWYMNIHSMDTTTRPDLLTPLIIEKNTLFVPGQVLAPERGEVVITNDSRVDTFIGTKVVGHAFTARSQDIATGNFQPLRFRFL